MEQDINDDIEKVQKLIGKRDAVMQAINDVHYKKGFFRPRIEIDDNIDGHSSLAEYDRMGMTIYISGAPGIYETPECFIMCLAHEGLHFLNDLGCCHDVDRVRPEDIHIALGSDDTTSYQYHNRRFMESAKAAGLYSRGCLLEWYRWIFNKLKEKWPEQFNGEYSDRITQFLEKKIGYSCCIAPDTESVMECMRKQGIL